MSRLVLLALAASSFAIPAPATPGQHSDVKPVDIYRFPVAVQRQTALENQAFRPDGSVLATSYTNNSIWQISLPFANPKFTQVTNFSFDPEVTATLGIVQTTPDVFYVATSEFNASYEVFSARPGTNKIYRLKFPGPVIELAALLPEAQALNGLTKLNDTYLLSSDSQKGVIWGIDTIHGTSKVLVRGESLEPYPALTATQGFGINGIKFHEPFVYFTNTIRSSLGRVELHHGSLRCGPVETIANFSLPGIDVSNNIQPDDLVVLEDGTALVALRSSAQIARVDSQAKISYFDLGEGYNATSLAFRGQQKGKDRLFATGMFARYFEVDLSN